MSSEVHSGRTYDACAVFDITLQTEIQANISETLSLLHRLCVQNKVTVHIFSCRREIRLAQFSPLLLTTVKGQEDLTGYLPSLSIDLFFI